MTSRSKKPLTKNVNENTSCRQRAGYTAITQRTRSVLHSVNSTNSNVGPPVDAAYTYSADSVQTADSELAIDRLLHRNSKPDSEANNKERSHTKVGVYRRQGDTERRSVSQQGVQRSEKHCSFKYIEVTQNHITTPQHHQCANHNTIEY